jgi:PQQ-like domain
MNSRRFLLKWPSNAATGALSFAAIVVITLCALFLYSPHAHAQAVLWTKTLSERERGAMDTACYPSSRERNIARDSAGDIYVAGASSPRAGNSTGDLVVAKFSKTSGALVWSKNYALGCATGISVDAAGNVAVSAQVVSWVPTQSGGTYPKRFFSTVKLAGHTGEILWQQTYGSTQNAEDYAVGVAADAAGNVFVFGASIYEGAAVIKYDGVTGARLWKINIDPQNSYRADGAILVDGSGDVYVGGGVEIIDSATFAVRKRGLTVKIAGSTGAVIWSSSYDVPKPVYAVKSMRLSSANELVVTGDGHASDALENPQVATAKHNASTGAVIWSTHFSADNFVWGEATDVALDASGNVFVTCTSYEPARISPSPDYLLGSVERVIKYSSNGALLWSVADGAVERKYAYGAALIVDLAGNVVVTGRKGSFETTDSGSIRFVAREWPTTKYDGATGNKLWSSTFARVEGNAHDSSGDGIVADVGGDVFALGRSKGADYVTDIRVIRYSGANGATVWNAVSEIMDAISSATMSRVDGSGNLVVAGKSGGVGALRVRKYDAATGSEFWANAIDNWSPSAMALDSSGNAYIAATGFNALVTSPSGPVLSGLRLFKFDARTGVKNWEAISDESVPVIVQALATDADGGVYARGYLAPSYSSGVPGLVTVKFNGSTGAQLWKLTHPVPGGGNGFSSLLRIGPDGNPFMVNVINDGLLTSIALRGTDFVRVSKHSAVSGNVIWDSAYGAADGVSRQPANFIVDAAGNALLLSAWSGPSVWEPQYHLTKFDGVTGMQVYDVLLPADGVSYFATKMLLDPFGNLILSYGQNKMVKVASATGEVLWTSAMPSPGLVSMSLLADGGIVATGTESSSATTTRVAQFDSRTGTVLWSRDFNVSARTDEVGHDLATSGLGIFMIGSSPPLYRKPTWFVQKLQAEESRPPGRTCRV